MSIDYSLYLIADDKACSHRSLIAAVEEVIDEGVTCVQLRIKNKPLKILLALGENLLTLLKPRKIPLIINDHVSLAKALDADGVHIGQADQPYAQVRKQLGYHKIIGLSIENIQQAKQCRSLDCDYFGVGPIFATTSKCDASPPLGIKALKQITLLLRPKPVVAIGGINESTVLSVLETGVSGIALAAGIFSSQHPKKTTQQLSALITAYLSLC